MIFSTRKEWRRVHEARATPEQIDALYETDLRVHHSGDRYCVCDVCMDEAYAKGEALVPREFDLPKGAV